MSLSEVSNILWKERQLLQLLLFKLETEQSILTSGKSRFLSDATREVELVIDEIKEVELLRSIAVQSLAAELGLATTEPSLRELAEVAPEPWNTIFADHRDAFLADTQEIQMTSAINKDLLQSGSKAARDALEWLHSGAPSKEDNVDAYSASGRATSVSAAGANLLNEAL